MELEFKIERTRNGYERTYIFYEGEWMGFKRLSKTPICCDRELSHQTLKARWDHGNTTDELLFEYKQVNRKSGKAPKLSSMEGGMFNGLDQKTIDTLKHGTNKDLLAL